MLELGRQLRDGPQQHALQRRHLDLVAVGSGFFDDLAIRAVIRNPLHTQMGIELRSEAGGEETIAEQTPRGVEDEHLELGLGNGKAGRPDGFREPANNRVYILDVVHDTSVRMSKTIVDGCSVVVRLRAGDDL